MTTAKIEDKTVLTKNEGTRSSQADLEKENQQNVDLEMQIQGKKKKAQRRDIVQKHR